MEDNDIYRFIKLICQKVNRKDDDVIKSHVNNNQSVLFHFSEKTRCNFNELKLSETKKRRLDLSSPLILNQYTHGIGFDYWLGKNQNFQRCSGGYEVTENFFLLKKIVANCRVFTGRLVIFVVVNL